MYFIKTAVIFYFLLKLNVINGNQPVGKGQLILSNVLFRHGERTPISPYPNDPWKNPSYWPNGFGQLTNFGKRQGFELGKYLRIRYRDILEIGYKPDMVYVRSTNTDRTIMTALTILAGMFPPTADEKWHPNIAWQPIPIHTIPRHLDHLLAFHRNCPKYTQLIQNYLTSSEYKVTHKKYRYLFNYLSQMTGMTIQTFTQVRNLYSIFYIQDHNNMTLPIWTKSIYPGGDMEKLVTLSETVRSQTHLMARLRGGFLLKNMLTAMVKHLSGIENPITVWMYSGHDTTITTLLTTLNMFKHHIVPFIACLMIELWIYNNEPYIEIYYKLPNSEIVHMEIPKCGKSCPLEKIFDLYENVLPEEFDDECAIRDIPFIYLAAPLLFGLCLILFGIFLLYRRMLQRSVNHVSTYLLKKFDI